MYKGQIFYRFNVTFNEGKVEVNKHTFEIDDCKEEMIIGEPRLQFRPRCVEDYKIKFKGGYYREEETFDFGKVKPSGNAIYVSLEEDDESKVLNLVHIYMKDRVEQFNRKLRQAEEELNLLESLINVRN